MIGVMRGWWADFKERHGICHWDQGIKWSRYNANSGVKEVGVEYHFGKQARRLMLSLEIDNTGEQLVTLRLGVPFLFNVYFSLDAKPNRFTKWFAGEDWSLGGRETGFSFDKEYVRLSLHKATNGWSSDTHCGYGSIWTWRDILMGDHDADLATSKLCMHEGDVVPSKGQPDGQKRVLFDAQINTYHSKYSRWYLFWYRPTYVRITLNPRAEIIVPGKGEHAYDQEDETMGEITFGCHTTTLAAALVEYNRAITRAMQR